MGEPLRILLSYWYYRDTDLAELVGRFPERPLVFADSGAYSAGQLAGAVDLDGYAGWLRRWSHLFAVYANLDVIGDPAATLRNQAELEAQGLHPLPVFHGGEPWEYLERYLADWPYVGLGGMVAADATVLRWCVQCHRMARDAGVALHGFGQTKVAVLGPLPWYSVDSSSWGYGHRFGKLSLWDTTRGGLRWAAVGTTEVRSQRRLILEHGYDPEVFLRPGCGLKRDGTPMEVVRAERAAIAGCNATARAHLEQWMRDRHGTIAPPAPNLPKGPLMYLADSTTGTWDTLLEGLEART